MKIKIIILSLCAVCGLTMIGQKIDQKELAEKIKNVKVKLTKLPDKDATLTIKPGDKLSYTGDCYLSVGKSFNAEYDKTAFELKVQQDFYYPEAIDQGITGGDESSVTYTFTALKKGIYTIKILHEFRGDIERTITYKVIVK